MAIGYTAMDANTTGAVNVAIGAAALQSNKIGTYNMAIGSLALQNVNNDQNTAIGFGALNGTTGYGNIGIGFAAQYDKTTGNEDVAIGLFAGRYQVSGGSSVTSSSNSVYIGTAAYPGKNNASNIIVIGHSAVGNGDNTTTIGNSSTTATYIPAGKLRIGNTTAPTATLHLPAGTSSANTAPLKFTSGTPTTTPEAGAVEWDGSNLFVTNSSASRRTVNQGLTGSTFLQFGTTAAQTSKDLTVTVTGASDGDVVSLGVPNGAVHANSCYTAWVSAANTVTIRFNNYSSASIAPGNYEFKIFVTKF
jgi:hypothetical protein